MLSKGVWLGLRVGAKTGFWLSVLYSLPLIFEYFFAMPLVGLIALGIAILIGVIPATLVGLLTGAIIDGLLQNLVKNATPKRAIFLGALISFWIVIAIHIVILILYPNFLNQGLYWLLIGIPSTIYILTSSFMAESMANHLQQWGLSENQTPKLDKAMMTAGVIFVICGMGMGYTSLSQRTSDGLAMTFVAITIGIALIIKFKSRKSSEPLAEGSKTDIEC